ncbi:zinc finger, CCHC-type containing protein [Tanacetum coccineum]
MTTGESVKEMTSKFDKLAKFEGQDFRRWQNKMHFFLTTLKVMYVLSTPSLEWSENETLEKTRKRMKWENDDYICRGHILNGMFDSLFDICQNVESAKTLCESLESKYMAEDASATKFLVSSFMNYKMVDTRPVMEQYHEMLRILGQYTQHNLMMDEAISVAVIIDKLPHSWKESKHSLKYKKEELNLVQLGSHQRIEEGLRNQELDNNPKGKNQIGSYSVYMVERDGTKNSNNNKNKRKFKSGDDKFANKKGTMTCWKCNKPGHMKKDCRSRKGKDGAGSNGSKDPEKQQGYNSDFIQNFYNVLHYVSVISDAFYVQDDEVAWWVDSGATSHVCKDLRWFQVCKSIEDGSFVKMGNVATEPIKGIGRVLLTFTSGKTLCLDNVLYVPGIRKNLVSEIVLNKCGYKQVLESDKYILSRHGLFVGFGYVCNGMIRLNLNYLLFNAFACMITSSHSNILSKSELWHARLGHVHYKRMRDMSKMSLIPAFDMTHESCKTCMLTKITRQPFKGVNRESKVLDLIHSDLCDFHANPSLGHNKYVITFIDDASRYCYVYLLHAKHEALDKFKIYKQEVELQRQDLIKVLRTDRGGEYYDPVYFQSTGIIHQTTAPYTPQQNGVAERKNRTLKEMVNSMLSYSGLSEGFWGEAMLTACYILNRTPNKNSKQTPYEIWTKKVPNLTYLRVWGCRAVVRLTEPKMKNLGEKGIDCIFIGYAEHSKCYRFYVIEPNDYVSVNSIIESRDAIFDEERFTSIPRPRGMIQPSSSKIAEDEVEGTDDVPGPSVPRKSTRTRKAKSFGSDFQLYLVEGTRDKTLSQREYCFIIEEDPRTLSEAMASRDVAFWKEAVQSEIDSIMHNDTWELTDLPPGCKALGCKWILKRKMKVDGSIDKYKARLVIQGFRQKEGIDFFDTYAPVARISTIRLLLALAAIHDLVIHQMDVKTAFLNGDLDEEIYMKQPEGFVMPGHESKVCKLKKSLYGLKQAPKQWHQKFDDVVLSNGFSLNQADKCVYSKFDASGKGVIICLYVDDMLIFGTDQDQVNKTKEFLSSNFDMKDLGEAEVILGIRIKRGNNGISISQSHYIEKILTKFNFANCSPVYTPVDPTVKFRPNKGTPVSQLEYSRAIGCLMYAMISTRPDIAFAVGKLSRYTSNPSALHWQALGRVFQYLKGTMDYGLTYSGYPSVIEGYSDASWINNMEDHSSTSGWVFLLGGGAISWASKKQTCITSSTMESEFVALAAAGNEAEWLRNLIYEIPLWPKPISTISIRCDSAATLAKAYSQVYNGKSRHLGVRHSKIRELIMNGVISVKFVKTQLNLADHSIEFCRP